MTLAPQDSLTTLSPLDVEAPVEDRELLPLLSLLDDPDQRIGETVMDRLRGKGEGVLWSLLDFVDRADDELAAERASIIVRELNEERLAKEFCILSKRLDWGDPRALEDGAFLVAPLP